MRQFAVATVAAVVTGSSLAAQAPAHCSPDNAGLTLPRGFCAQVIADSLGNPRHVAALPNGDLAVAIDGRSGGVMILHDANGDGIMETRNKFGPRGGTGIAYYHGYLYFGLNNMVLRWALPDGASAPVGEPDTVVSGLAFGSQHSAKNIAIGPDGTLYVNIGAPSNSCQQNDRQVESPGRDPCPILDTAGGIWRFDSGKLHQTQADGHRFATGLRNVVSLNVDQNDGSVWGVQHGRDQLGQNWPRLFDTAASAEKPAEELFKIEDGGNYGWPYCFYDPAQHLKVLAPEYGGDGKTVGRCNQFRDPAIAFPAHYAPDGSLEYHATQFPSSYRGGMFIAFHGSWNRAPLPQEGYNVVFVPFRHGVPEGTWTVFADGFRGPDRSAQAQHRPCGVAVARDGSLIVTDDRAGRVYRISYTGR